MELLIGTVKVKGTKENVVTMFEDLEDYYDKSVLKQKGTDERYEMEFEFSSKMTSFFSYGDYFRGYSEGYECHIKAELYVEDEEDDEPMILEYKNGEIIHGVSEYGFEGEDF